MVTILTIILSYLGVHFILTEIEKYVFERHAEDYLRYRAEVLADEIWNSSIIEDGEREDTNEQI